MTDYRTEDDSPDDGLPEEGKPEDAPQENGSPIQVGLRKWIIGGLVLAIIIGLYWRLHTSTHVLGEAYVADQSVTLRTTLAQVHQRAGDAHWGDQVEILNRSGADTLVRTGCSWVRPGLPSGHHPRAGGPARGTEGDGLVGDVGFAEDMSARVQAQAVMMARTSPPMIHLRRPTWMGDPFLGGLSGSLPQANHRPENRLRCGSPSRAVSEGDADAAGSAYSDWGLRA